MDLQQRTNTNPKIAAPFFLKEIKPLKHFGGALKNIKAETVKKGKNADALWLVTG